MNRQDKILSVGFALFSAVTSFSFVFYAVTVILGAGASPWLKAFAYVAGGYGVFNIYTLSWAWNSGTDWAQKANLVIAACFFGVVVMDTLRDGLSGGIRALGVLLGLAAILVLNWFAVKKLCQRRT